MTEPTKDALAGLCFIALLGGLLLAAWAFFVVVFVQPEGTPWRSPPLP